MEKAEVRKEKPVKMKMLSRQNGRNKQSMEKPTESGLIVNDHGNYQLERLVCSVISQEETSNLLSSPQVMKKK
jgi:hypothetical protein